MTKPQFAILISVLVLGFVIVAMAQTFGSLGISPIAPLVTNCPPGTANTATLCPVGSGSTFTMYVSYNGGAYQLLVPPPPAGVASVNGKTGALTITVQ